MSIPLVLTTIVAASFIIFSLGFKIPLKIPLNEIPVNINLVNTQPQHFEFKYLNDKLPEGGDPFK